MVVPRYSVPIRFSPLVRVISLLPVGRGLVLRLVHYAARKLGYRRHAMTYFGATLTCDTRDFVQATIARFGTWEPNVSAIAERLIEPGDTVLDVGANIGYFTLLFASLAGPSGRVIAIEAHPAIAAANQANLDRNRVANVTIANVAVTAEAGEVTLWEGPRSNIGSTSIVPGRAGAKGISVPGRPLFDILDGVDLTRISLIKMDIEGAEIPVLLQLLDRIDEFGERFALIAEASIAADPRWPAVFDRFMARGFSAYAIPNPYEWDAHFARTVEAPRPIEALEEGVFELLLTRGPLHPSA